MTAQEAFQRGKYSKNLIYSLEKDPLMTGDW